MGLDNFDQVPSQASLASSNQAPTADNQNLTTAEDVALAIVLTGSGSDSGPQPLSFAVSLPPANGSLSGTAPNLTYTPNANFNGSDSFTFTVNDGQYNSPPATVAITVTAVEDFASASDDAAAIIEDSGVNAINVLANDSADPDDGLLEVAGVGLASNGLTAFTMAGVSYSPNANFCGGDSFGYSVNGGASATVTVTVTCVNDAPVSSPLSDQTVAVSQAVSIATAGAFVDPEGSALTFSVAGLPASLSMDPGTGLITGSPTVADIGMHNVVATATDPEVAGTDSALCCASSLMRSTRMVSRIDRR